MISSLLRRPNKRIIMKRPSKEKGIWFRFWNAEIMRTHIAALEKIFQERITPHRLANLDESNDFANRDDLGRIKAKCFVRTSRSRTNQVRMPTFKKVGHVTVVPVIFGNGEPSAPLFIIQGKLIRMQEVFNEYTKQDEIETLYNCLPPGSIFAHSKLIADMDTNIFTSWAEKFVAEMETKTHDGRATLLTHDRYKSHLGLKAL